MTRFWITLDQSVDLVLFALDNMVGGEVFIPKIPSMRVVDLADAMAPSLPREVIGIRPGEKLHELLLTVDESRHAVDADDVYVVLPEHPWWDDHPAGSRASRSTTASSTPATGTSGGSRRKSSPPCCRDPLRRTSRSTTTTSPPWWGC